MVVRGMSTGEIGLKFSTFRRSDGELLFWFGMVMNVLIAVILLLAFIFGRSQVPNVL
jgi:hypothetical protein